MSRLPRVETLLVLACAAGAAMLAASQFTTLFELTPPGGEALSEVKAEDQHGYATLVLALFALVMLVVGIAAKTESMAQIAAFAVAASGAVALLIFLIVDLPDANSIGTLDDARESFIDAEAEPVAGFWFELIGSLILAVCGASLATMGPESFSIGMRSEPETSGAESGNGTTPEGTQPAGRRLFTRRPRAGREAGGAIGPEDDEPETAEPAAKEPESKDEDDEKDGGGIKMPSLPKLSMPKFPLRSGKRKRIGQSRPEAEKSEDEKSEDADEGGSFNWPSRSKSSSD